VRDSKRVLLTICFGVIFTDMVGYGVISPSIPLFARTLGASDAQMGFAFAGYPIAFTLTVLPLGVFVDRVGKNWLIVTVAMFVLALASVLMAYASSVTMLVLARGLQGFASAAAWVASQPLIARGTGGAAEMDSREMSLVTIAAGLGIIAGPLLGGVGDIETPFLINAALAFFWGVAALFLLTRADTVAPGKKPPFRDLLRNKGIVIACIAIFCSCTCFGILELLLPLHLDRLGYAKLAIGLFFGVFSVLYVAAQPLISRWIDARGGYEPIYVGSLGLAVMMVLIIHVTGVAGLSAMLALAGVFSGALFLASMFVVGQNSAEGQRGSAYALWNLAFSLGYLVGPTAGGNLSTLFGLPTAFHAFAGVLLAGTVGIYLATRARIDTEG
jgi:DHA1 family solute carrier family 18 vesicular amine transporter 1/2